MSWFFGCPGTGSLGIHVVKRIGTSLYYESRKSRIPSIDSPFNSIVQFHGESYGLAMR